MLEYYTKKTEVYFMPQIIDNTYNHKLASSITVGICQIPLTRIKAGDVKMF
ncbi:MAG: hypothetical protein II992_12630 [Lachnospiraceae bacterium]|nr:hypothetical protein [Lachnospiraceae bacterium]